MWLGVSVSNGKLMIECQLGCSDAKRQRRCKATCRVQYGLSVNVHGIRLCNSISRYDIVMWDEDSIGLSPAGRGCIKHNITQHYQHQECDCLYRFATYFFLLLFHEMLCADVYNAFLDAVFLTMFVVAIVVLVSYKLLYTKRVCSVPLLLWFNFNFVICFSVSQENSL